MFLADSRSHQRKKRDLILAECLIASQEANHSDQPGPAPARKQCGE